MEEGLQRKQSIHSHSCITHTHTHTHTTSALLFDPPCIMHSFTYLYQHKQGRRKEVDTYCRTVAVACQFQHCESCGQ